MSDLWYYAEGSETIGPVDLDGLAQSLKRKTRPEEVLIWQEGYADWVEAGTIPALRAVLVRPPPVPVRSVTKPVMPEQRVSPLSPEYRQALQAEQKPRNWMGTISSWVVIVLSVVLSRVFGAAYWMPVLLIALCVWIFTKLKMRDYAVWMFGILVGHTLWMTVGHATLYGMGKSDPEFYTFLFDFVVVTALTIWGIRTQSVAVSIGVLVYQIIALATNVVYFDEYSKVSPTAAGMHVFLRAIGIGLAIYAIVKARQSKRGEEMEPVAI